MLCAVLVAVSVQAQAQPEGARDRTTRRLEEIERSLAAEGPPARRWHRAWPLFYGALAIGQGIGAVFWEQNRSMLAVGAVVSAVGGVGRISIPFAPTRADRRLARFPEDTQEQRTRKLLEAERLLERSAKVESRGRSILPIAGAAVVSGTGAAVLWFGYEEKVGALTMLTGGLVVAEVVRETQPHALQKDWLRYETRWHFSMAPGGLSLVRTF